MPCEYDFVLVINCNLFKVIVRNIDLGSAFGGHCEVDEQCYNVLGAMCRTTAESNDTMCQCPKGNYRFYFGRCLKGRVIANRRSQIMMYHTCTIAYNCPMTNKTVRQTIASSLQPTTINSDLFLQNTF